MHPRGTRIAVLILTSELIKKAGKDPLKFTPKQALDFADTNIRGKSQFAKNPSARWFTENIDNAHQRSCFLQDWSDYTGLKDERPKVEKADKAPAQGKAPAAGKGKAPRDPAKVQAGKTGKQAPAPAGKAPAGKDKPTAPNLSKQAQATASKPKDPASLKKTKASDDPKAPAPQAQGQDATKPDPQATINNALDK